MRGADLMAILFFYPSDQGGRRVATPAGIFRCPLEFKGELFDCGVLLDQTGPVAPGDTVTVPIVLMNPSLVKSELKVGAHFTLWETRSIASGVVVSILPDQASGPPVISSPQ